MKWIVRLAIILVFFQFFVPIPICSAEQKNAKKGPYLVVEGNVSQIFTRSLLVDGQQYPISMFARVFETDLNGREVSLQSVVNRGKIDQARLYILGGKVEKIVVLNNI